MFIFIVKPELTKILSCSRFVSHPKWTAVLASLSPQCWMRHEDCLCCASLCGVCGVHAVLLNAVAQSNAQPWPKITPLGLQSQGKCIGACDGGCVCCLREALADFSAGLLYSDGVHVHYEIVYHEQKTRKDMSQHQHLLFFLSLREKTNI